MEDKNQKNGNNENGSMPPNQRIINFLILGFIVTFLINMFLTSLLTRDSYQIDYNQFIELVESGLVDNARISYDQVQITLKEDFDTARVNRILGSDRASSTNELSGSVVSIQPANKYFTGLVEDANRLTDRFRENNVAFSRPIVRSNPFLSFISSWIFPILLMYIFYFLIIRALLNKMGGSGGLGGFMNMGKSKATLYGIEKDTGILFKDVAGQDEAKESLHEMVDFLHSPEKYQQIGAKQPKGALLVGPPGTGKTLLAKAVAGEAKVPFFSLSGSEFVEMYVGVGASRVRDLFQQANKNAPCIIFIDEIDAIGKKRDSQVNSNDEREQTLNQLLAEMDGFDSSKGIVILAATNRPEILDKALLRPGRFDRRIIVEKPDLPGREAILEVHTAKVKMGDSITIKEIALATSGATGADLANMVNEAALRAVRMGRKTVLQEDLMESVEVIIAGKEKKDRILNPTEKKMVAYHEVGHALASALQKNSQPVQKITIVPRTMGSLGYTMQMPEEERYLTTKSEILSQITTLLAGRTAEEITFNESSTGATNDIERATKLARNMITQYGMSENFDMMGLESTENQYLDGRNVSNCSEATGLEIDNEVRAIIKACHKKAKDLLLENREALEKISEYLVEKETISGEQFMQLLKPPNEEENENSAEKISVEVSKEGIDSKKESMIKLEIKPKERPSAKSEGDSLRINIPSKEPVQQDSDSDTDSNDFD